MNRVPFLYAVIACLLLASGAAPLRADEVKPHGVNTVIIDAGHGGKDSGARGSKSLEKNIVLSVSKMVGERIKAKHSDVNVIYTRSTDVFIPLNERANIANKNNADLFISIHANAVKNTNVRGTETFILGLHRTEENLAVAKLENSVITLEDDYSTTYEGFDPSSSESYIIFNFLQNNYIDKSLLLADNIQSRFANQAKRGNRGVRQAGFLVLRKVSMPSVLVELGFITNRNEEAYMLSQKGKDELANSIVQAFTAYKEEVDKKTGIAQVEKKEETTVPVASNAPITSSPIPPRQAQAKVPEKQEEIKAKEKPEPKQEVKEEIYFRVQFLATSTKRKAPIKKDKAFKGIPDVRTESANGIYKYTAGDQLSYKQANALKKKLKKKYPQAFLVAYQAKIEEGKRTQEQRMNIKEALSRI